MLRQLGLLLTNPRKYLPVALARAEQRLCRLFRDMPFFLQGQMDIRPGAPWHDPEFVEATGGFFPRGGHGDRRIHDLDPWDNVRRDMLVLLLRTIVERDVPGEMAELGVYRGLTARLLHHYAPERRLHLFDTFRGFTDRGLEHFTDTSLEAARACVAPRNDNVVFHPGSFPDTIRPELASARFAFVHLDADLHDPILAGLEFFYPRTSPGGMIVVHDYNAWRGARNAVDAFFADKPEPPIPMPDKSGSALIVRR